MNLIIAENVDMLAMIAAIFIQFKVNMNKKEFGQFYTTNVDYILSEFEYCVNNKSILDPFAGNGDLLRWAQNNNAKTTGYDIDSSIYPFNDSLLNIPQCDFILTNPPYLAKNKMSGAQKSKYNCEDLYLLAIERIIESNINEGILILPVNFLSSNISVNIRKRFFNQYLVSKVNYFNNQVFDDTTYNVISFHFIKKESSKQQLNIVFYPEKVEKSFIIDSKYDYLIGGEEIATISSIKSLDHSNKPIKDACLIKFNCIDKKNAPINAEQITLEQFEINSSRNSICISFPDIKSNDIVELFNSKLNNLRNKYNSLFLTNFRDNNRKRISFEFCYKT